MITLIEGDNFLNVPLTPNPVPVANLYGTVRDAATGLPLQGVTVEVGGVVTLTDASGAYSIIGLVPGSYEARFSKPGYQTVIY